MIVSEEEATKRLNHPMNLMNRMKDSGRASRKDAMSLFGLNRNRDNRQEENQSQPSLPSSEQTTSLIPSPKSFNPFETKDTNTAAIPSASVSPSEPNDNSQSKPPTLDNLLDDNAVQIRLSLAHDNALQTLNDAVERMRLTLDDIKPEKLPAVVSATSKVVESIRKERLQLSKDNTEKSVHYHFYTPVQKKSTDYEVIEVG